MLSADQKICLGEVLKKGVTTMPDFNWFKSALIMILTMRADDAKKWDPLELVGLAKSFHVDALGFSAGGIMAFYPTQIDDHPRSPWLSGKDLVGETVEALHRGGLRAIGRIDPSLASNDLFLKHPDWFTVDANNCPITVHDSFVTCPNGNYYYQFIPDVIKEILDNYEFDGLWANAARFAAWHSKQCFCSVCQEKFEKASGHSIPIESWGDPVWLEYNEWRYQCIGDWMRYIHDQVQRVRSDCAWLPLCQVVESWDDSRPGGWDPDYVLPHADAMVLEAQRRYPNIWWPGLEARYLRGLNPEKAANVTVSYFFPWWRFYSVPDPENRLWIAQIVANGARPWLHITGYYSELFDRRGFDSLRKMLKKIKENPDAYTGLQSLAEVAIVYSRFSQDNYGGEFPEKNYINHFRGFYNAMMVERIPFDVISDKFLSMESLRRYRVLILPNMACMAKKTAETIAEYVKSGGLLITTYKTGLFDEMGKERNDFLLAPVISASYSGSTLKNIRAAYGYIRNHDHPICRSFENTELIPLVGDLCLVSADACRNAHPLTLITSIEGKGGSGISVPEFNKIERNHITDLPLIIENKFGRGHSIFFPFQPDKAAYEYGLPDMFRLLGNAVRMAPGWKDRVEVQGAGLLDISVTGDENRMVIHILNFSSPGSFNSGQRRPMQQIVPIHDLKMTVRLPRDRTCNGVKLVFNKARVTPVIKDGKLPITIPELNELESVVLSLK